MCECVCVCVWSTCLVSPVCSVDATVSFSFFSAVIVVVGHTKCVLQLLFGCGLLCLSGLVFHV